MSIGKGTNIITNRFVNAMWAGKHNINGYFLRVVSLSRTMNGRNYSTSCGSDLYRSHLLKRRKSRHVLTYATSVIKRTPSSSTFYFRSFQSDVTNFNYGVRKVSLSIMTPAAPHNNPCGVAIQQRVSSGTKTFIRRCVRRKRPDIRVSVSAGSKNKKNT